MFLKFYLDLMNRIQSEEGQDLAEYALLLALIAILLVAALTAFRTQLAAVFANIVTALTGVAP